MPAQLAANPGGTALTLGTVNVDCTAVMPDPGAVAYPDQLRLDVVAFRVGSAPLTAGFSRPWLLTACAAAFGMNEASVNAAADSTARRAGRRDTGTTLVEDTCPYNGRTREPSRHKDRIARSPRRRLTRTRRTAVGL